ncbi:MAG: M12 family metallo-peptidase [Thermoanaerobaculia bacterium]
MILAGGALLLAAGPVRAAAPALPVVQSQDFAGVAAKMAAGSRLRLENLPVAGTGESRALVLERFEVFARDAKITVHGDGGDKVLPAPANVYFRGVVDGRPGSRAFLAKLADGRTQGVISEEDDVYLIGGDDAAAKALGGPLEMHRVDPVLLKAARGEAFNCGNAELPGLSGKGAVLDLGGITSQAAAPLEKEVAAATPAHTARVAIESDFELYSLFNNSTNATNYVGNLIGYASTIYTAELNTSLVVQSVSLWTTSNDPWTQTQTLCGLFEFGKYWNQNRTNVSRTIAHFLSGKSLGGGVAWLNALCHGPFFTGGASSCPGLGTESTSWGGDYGFTANISGSFNINSPTVVWDIYSTSHEMGHNFGSPHSHCYNGLEGNASPIDQCYGGESGCYSGATSLPGPAGTRSGTIMSYCHLIGGYGAIALTFGTNFAYGVQPGREAAHMNSYISSVASSNPACIAPVSVSGLFGDGFEGGTVPGLWSGKTP